MENAELLPPFILIYGVAFLTLFLLRRWAWLGLGAVAAVVVMVALFWWMDHSSGDAGMGVMFLGFTVGLGFVSGGIARAVLLAVSHGRERWFRREVIAALLFFFGLPLTLYGLARALA